MQEQMIRIIQISDLHLLSNKLAKFLSIEPYLNLEKIVNRVKIDVAEYKPNFIALTGDLSQDYSENSYKIFKEIFQDFKIPIYAILGNHDRPELFNKICPNFKAQNIMLENWQILFLNSHWTNHIEGYIDDSELQNLEENLSHNLGHVLIFLHHHVLPIKSTWLDRLNLKNADQFLSICDRYKNIKLVVSGHVHQESLQTRNGIDFISTPATCFQFTPQSKIFKLESSMPGYRRIELDENGNYKTEVMRIPYESGLIPDLMSKGY